MIPERVNLEIRIYANGLHFSQIRFVIQHPTGLIYVGSNTHSGRKLFICYIASLIVVQSV